MAEQIELSYYGGDADRHVLDLYDAGRALYGAARFIYTLENFRVNGVIVEHATSARVKFELDSISHGCFTFSISNIIAAIGPEQAVKILNVPFTALLSWIVRKMSGDDQKQSVEIERERTTQLAIASVRDVAMKAIESKEASEERQMELIRRYADDLSQVSEQRVRELSTKLRPSMIDMARPTTNDAAYMTLSINKSTPLLYMDERTVENLKGNMFDPAAELTSEKFIQYNVETGWGKVRLPWRLSPYRFSVHPIIRPYATPEILEAMEESKSVWVWVYMLKDKAGNVISLRFDRFAKQEEIPPA